MRPPQGLNVKSTLTVFCFKDISSFLLPHAFTKIPPPPFCKYWKSQTVRYPWSLLQDEQTHLLQPVLIAKVLHCLHLILPLCTTEQSLASSIFSSTDWTDPGCSAFQGTRYQSKMWQTLRAGLSFLAKASSDVSGSALFKLASSYCSKKSSLFCRLSFLAVTSRYITSSKVRWAVLGSVKQDPGCIQLQVKTVELETTVMFRCNPSV